MTIPLTRFLFSLYFFFSLPFSISLPLPPLFPFPSLFLFLLSSLFLLPLLYKQRWGCSDWEQHSDCSVHQWRADGSTAQCSVGAEGQESHRCLARCFHFLWQVWLTTVDYIVHNCPYMLCASVYDYLLFAWYYVNLLILLEGIVI